MNNKDLSDKDSLAAQYLGKTYVKVPLAIVNRLLDAHKHEHQIGLVHLILFLCSKYADTQSVVNGKMIYCKAGEVITTYDFLAQNTDLGATSLRRYIKSLQNAGLVSVEREAGGSCFRVCGYEQFMRNTEKPSDVSKANKTRTGKPGEPEAEAWSRESKKPRTDLLD